MKRNIYIILLFLTINVFSQKDFNKNFGFFNITRFGAKAIINAELETFDTSNGIVVSQLQTNNANSFSLQTINGYFISSEFSVGLGIGLDRYNNPNANTLPIFFDARYYLSDEVKSIYFVTNLGSLLKIENGTRKGSMANIGVGYKFPINKNNKTIIVTDLNFSHKSISLDGLSISKSENFMRLNGVLITFGILF